jgi:hypothetical protein
MAVTAHSFQQWLGDAAPGVTTAEVCRRSGIKRTTLAQQLVRGKVSLATVVAVARAFGVQPVQALGAFEGYRDLPQGTRPPLDAELVSQVATLDILRLIIARSQGPSAAVDEPEALLEPFPHESSVRAWFEAIDPGDLRQSLARQAGIAPQNLSAQLSSGRLSPDLAVMAGRAAGVSLASGLVVTGLLSPEEGAWRPGSRVRVLDSLSTADLMLLARDRLETWGKTLKRAEHSAARDRAMWENLG